MIVSKKENLITRRSNLKSIEIEKIILNMGILCSPIYATQSNHNNKTSGKKINKERLNSTVVSQM